LFQDSFEEAFEPPIPLHGVINHKVTIKDGFSTEKSQIS